MKGCSKSSTRRCSARANAGIFALGAFITASLFLLSLILGSANIGVSQILRWLTGGEVSAQIHNIMLYVRLQRSFAALLCGSALALSGLLLQSALHNPLASAGTIGVNSGAGLFAVLAAAAFRGAFIARPAFAFAGALFAVALVFGVSRKAGSAKTTIIMAGIAVGSLLSAGTDVVVTFWPDTIMDRTAFFIGGFSSVSMQAMLYALPFLAVGFVGAAWLSVRMNVLALGDEMAASLGLNVRRIRILIILCAALLAAGAVCIGGLLGFVGLIVPYAARFLVGYDHKRLVPLTAILGAALVLLCDTLARTAFAPYELPVGILLSLLGAPFFLSLIMRRKRVAL